MEKENIFEKNIIQERIKSWAEKLIDLSGTNDLISYRDAKTISIKPSKEIVDKLIEGASVKISEIIDLEDKEQKKGAFGVVKKAVENFEDYGIEVLRLISGFVSWESDVSNPYAPLVTYALSIDNPNQALKNIEISLTDLVPEINTALVLHLNKKCQADISIEKLEEVQEEGEEVLVKTFLDMCPKEIGIKVKDGFAIKNLQYQQFPMVNDLLSSFEVFSENTLVAALAGDEESKLKLREHITEVPVDEPDYTPPENEFIVLDADSSQQWAINSALKGQNLVIEGPPGTGKSQTITNLISSFIAKGKSVLFVAEKRPAIDAVKKRIIKVGLEDCLLDLHSIKQIKSRPADPFVNELENLNSVPKVDDYINKNNLIKSRNILVSRSKAILKKVAPWNCSYLDIINYGFDNEFVDHSYDLEIKEINKLIPDNFDEIRSTLDEIIKLSSEQLLVSSFPISEKIRNRTLDSNSQIQELLKVINNLDPLVNNANKWILKQDETYRENVDTPQKILDLLSNLKQIKSNNVISIPNEESFLPIESVKKILRIQRRPFILRFCQFLFDKEYRFSLSELKPLFLEGVKKDNIKIKDACKTLISKYYLSKNKIPIKNLNIPDQFGNIIREIIKESRSLNLFINAPINNHSYIDELKDQLDNLNSLREKLPNSVKITKALNKLEAFGLKRNCLIEQILEDIIDGFSSITIYQQIISSWANKVEEIVRIDQDALAISSREFLDETVETFRKSDATHVEQTGQRIRRMVAENAHKVRTNSPEGIQILIQESKRRKKKSARKLFTEIPDLLKSLKPCWAMSPLVVSQLLPANEPFFDVVIFDEASQIEPEGAITSLVRAKQAIVAGDSKQLSPTKTSFFSQKLDDDIGYAEDTDESFDNVAETESLLEAVKTALPAVHGTKTLLWHYRSEDERLIAFSNRHQDLYRSRLITAPSVTEKSPFVYHQVEGDFKDISGKCPIAEIEKTVSLAIDHLKNNPNESLGVIALGSDHARSLYKEFQRQSENLSLQLWPENKPEEKFIIRHLENVQGDERDVIFLSTGYGPRKHDTVRLDFGPINSDKNLFGLRRLNVAITRSRKRLEVISTIDPYRYDDNKLNKIGLKAFIQYLRFVKSGGEDMGDLVIEKTPMNSFEQDVYDTLVKEGIGLVPQYGVSGYRLDFAVQHPEEKGKFILAIEADGAAYHSTETARDRDRIRQSHLERLGWKFHRIWGPSWAKRKEEEIEKVLSVIDDAIKSGEVVNKSNSKTKKKKDKLILPQRKGKKPYLPYYENINQYGDELTKYILWICSDDLLHSDEQIFEEIFKELPYTKRGNRIRRVIDEEIKYLRSKGKIK